MRNPKTRVLTLCLFLLTTRLSHAISCKVGLLKLVGLLTGNPYYTNNLAGHPLFEENRNFFGDPKTWQEVRGRDIADFVDFRPKDSAVRLSFMFKDNTFSISTSRHSPDLPITREQEVARFLIARKLVERELAARGEGKEDFLSEFLEWGGTYGVVDSGIPYSQAGIQYMKKVEDLFSPENLKKSNQELLDNYTLDEASIQEMRASSNTGVVPDLNGQSLDPSLIFPY